jgi:hypothetical protein
MVFGLNRLHPTADLYRTFLKTTLPVLGISYTSMLIYIKKSLLAHKPEMIEFDINNSGRRSDGNLLPCRFRKKNRLGTDISHLGVKLYNQLPSVLKNLKNLRIFKKEVKSYLQDKIDLILAADQFHTRQIT